MKVQKKINHCIGWEGGKHSKVKKQLHHICIKHIQIKRQAYSQYWTRDERVQSHQLDTMLINNKHVTRCDITVYHIASFKECEGRADLLTKEHHDLTVHWYNMLVSGGAVYTL